MLEGAWIPKALPRKQLPRSASQPMMAVFCARNKILLCYVAEILGFLVKPISYIEYRQVTYLWT